LHQHTRIRSGIQRGPRPTSNFTVNYNDVINDTRLSFRARGVLLHLLSKPAEWEARSIAIAAQSPREGRDAIRTAMRELEEFGYLTRDRVRHADGTFTIEQTIHEIPVDTSAAPGPGNPEDDSSGAGRSGSTQRTDRARTETNQPHTTSVKLAPTQRAPKRVGVVASAKTDDRLDALAVACRDKGLAARFDALKPEQADIIAALLETHGPRALAKAAADAHRADNPTRYAQGYIRTWDAMPLPRRDNARPTCSACTNGWIEDPVTGLPVSRCACRTTASAVAA